jgi:heme/copper-type cytochrome/quinol oxidase subunit 2
MNVGIALFFILFINIAIFALIFFTIRYFIQYYVRLKNKKSQQQEEIDRMNIEDL